MRFTARLLTLGAMLLLAAAWFAFMRPASLGGPAGYLYVNGVSMEPTLVTGDLVITRRAEHYRAGQIVAFRPRAGQPGAGAIVIHRIVGGSADGFVVQGDNKPGPDEWRPAEADIVGALWVRIPGAGVAIGWLRSPTVMASLAAAVTVFAVLMWGAPRPAPVAAADRERTA